MNFSIRKDIRKLLVVTFVILPLLNLFIGGTIGIFMSSGEELSFLFPENFDGGKAFKIAIVWLVFFFFPFLIVQLLWVIGMWCKKFID